MDCAARFSWVSVWICIMGALLCTPFGLIASRPNLPTRAHAYMQLTGGDKLAARVRDAILDEEERPFVIWNEAGPKPLKINLDLLNHRGRALERRQEVRAALFA